MEFCGVRWLDVVAFSPHAVAARIVTVGVWHGFGYS